MVKFNILMLNLFLRRVRNTLFILITIFFHLSNLFEFMNTRLPFKLSYYHQITTLMDNNFQLFHN